MTDIERRSLVIMECSRAAALESKRLRSAGHLAEAAGAMSVAEMLLTQAEAAQAIEHVALDAARGKGKQ